MWSAARHIVTRSPGAPPLSIDMIPELSMSTGWKVMPSAVTGLGPSTSAVESKFGPPECPGSSTTTGRLAVHATSWAGELEVETGEADSELVASAEAPQATAQHAAATTPAAGTPNLLSLRPIPKITSNSWQPNGVHFLNSDRDMRRVTVIPLFWIRRTGRMAGLRRDRGDRI